MEQVSLGLHPVEGLVFLVMAGVCAPQLAELNNRL
jgi:hypothetical protein